MYNQKPLIELTPKEVIDYLRKSRTDDPLLTVEEVLAKHEAMLDEWAINNLGAKVPEENKFREVASSETIKERPEFQKVLRLIENPKYKAVKVVEPQRLTRGDLEDIGRIMKLLKHTNTLVITPQRIYDLRDEYDFDAFERELKRGNEYLEYYKKIQHRGKLLSISQGNYIGSVPPYGYDKTYVMDGKRKCPTLKENKAEADIVRMIFDLYVNHNMGRQRIANRLEELKLKPKKAEHWSVDWISEVLRNIHYIGKVRWNWRKTVISVEDGEFVKSRPETKLGEYLIYDGKHEGIVPVELFNAAQENLGKNPRVSAKKKMRNPFAGVLYCGKCGRAMMMHNYKDRNINYEERARLLCSSRNVVCDNASCHFDDVKERVCQILKQCIEDFEVRVKNDEGNSAKLHASLIKNLEKRLKELEEKELSQWEQQSHPDENQRMPAHIFKQLNERLLKEKQEVQEGLCKAYASMPEPVDYQEKILTFTDALNALNDDTVPVERQNALLKQCIERIDYKRERPQRIQFKGKFKGQSPWNNPAIELDVKLRV